MADVRLKSQSKTTPANLECLVCEEVFSLEGDNVPRLLHCGHTLCHSCLSRLPLTGSDLLCPFDRLATPVGASGVSGLKKNFALIELLERLDDERRTESDPRQEERVGRSNSRVLQQQQNQRRQQQQQQQQQRQTQQQVTEPSNAFAYLAAGVVGAAVGAIACYAFSDSKKQSRKK